MEEKTKNIIYSVIAILLGLIIGGCTQVHAATPPAVENLNVWIRGNLDYAYMAQGLNFNIQIDNANFEGYTNKKMWEDSQEWMKTFPVIRIRFCSMGENTKDVAVPTGVVSDGYYGKPLNLKYYTTSTACSWTQPWEGGSTFTGNEVEIAFQLSEGHGYRNYADIDTGRYQTQLYVEYGMIGVTGGIIAKIRYTFDGKWGPPKDAIITDMDKIEDKLDDIINGGNYKKPTKDEILSEYENKEEELWEIIGVPNYNDINIDIDENTSSKIWNLIVYILRQNTAILTMVITILSISILKLILNR